MKIKILLLLSYLNLTYLFGQEIKTSGDNSPAVIAQNFSVTYGVRSDAIEAILWIYEAENYSLERCRRATEQILHEYTQSPEKQQKKGVLSESTRSKMSPQIADALEWDLFASSYYLSTMGYNSPAVVARGNVDIWYGISPKALRSLALRLEKNKIDLSDFETQLSEQVKKYKELKLELKTYNDQEEVYKQAELLLEEGKLEEAEELIESDFDASMKRQAYKGYIYGKTKEMLLKYEEAAKGYRNAINNDGDNIKYYLYYARNENYLSHYDEAITYIEIALSMDIIKNEDEKMIAFLLNTLGSAWSRKGKYNKAIEYYEKALPIFFRFFGENHSKVALVYHNYAEALGRKGKYEKAIKYLDKALQIDLKIFGENHPITAKEYYNLGLTYESKGEYDKAIKYHEKALQSYLKIFDGKHDNIGAIYNGLGSNWLEKRGYDKALGYFEKALLIYLSIFDNDHPYIATTYTNFGEAWHGKKEYDKAIEYYNKALQIYLNTLGENHENVAINYNNLGLVWDAKKEYDKAIECYEKALQIYLNTLGENHPYVAINYNNLGLVWNAKKEYDKAIECYEKALQIYLNTFDKSHINFLAIYQNLGWSLFKKEEYKKAISNFEKAIDNIKRRGDDDITTLVWFLNTIGASHKYLHQYEEGLLTLDEGLRIAKQGARQNNFSIIRRMQFHKVGCLKGLKKDKKAYILAEQLWKEGIQTNDTRLLEDLKKNGYDF